MRPQRQVDLRSAPDRAEPALLFQASCTPFTYHDAHGLVESSRGIGSVRDTVATGLADLDGERGGQVYDGAGRESAGR